MTVTLASNSDCAQHLSDLSLTVSKPLGPIGSNLDLCFDLWTRSSQQLFHQQNVGLKHQLAGKKQTKHCHFPCHLANVLLLKVQHTDQMIFATTVFQMHGKKETIIFSFS